MKKVIATFAVLVALTGVIVVKANEAKFKATASAVYYDVSGTATALLTTGIPSQFQTGAGGTQAQIRDKFNANHLLYEDVNEITAIQFVP